MPKVRKNKRRHVDNPYKYLAYSISTEEDDVWEEKPVSIREFVESTEFLNLKWDGTKGCRPKILEILEKVVDPKVREAILLLGKGSGKDFGAAILQLYGIHVTQCMYNPQAYYNLSPGSPIYFTNVARNESQGKNVFFQEFLGMLENCSWFEDKFSTPTGQSVKFDKNVVALSGNSQAFSWLGYNTIQWVGDELAFFLEKNSDDDSGESKAEECWEAAYGSCQTRFPHHYKMIGITTPRFDDDFVMRKFYELQRDMENDGSGYAVQMATWEVNPSITKKDFARALARNFRRTMRDFGAEPMGVIETFWGDPDFILNNVCSECRNCPIYQNRKVTTDNYACFQYEDCKANAYAGNGRFREWFVPDPNASYYLHFDLSKNKDKTGFACAHVIDWVEVELDPFEKMNTGDKDVNASEISEDDLYEERPVINCDFIGWINPSFKEMDPRMLLHGEIYYNAIIRYIIFWMLEHGFNIELVTSDQYAHHMFQQTLEEKGVPTELLSLDRNDEVPVAAKDSFIEGRVIYPYVRPFAREARHLKYIRGNKVDHPTGEAKDIIDGVFGSVYNCETQEASGAGFEILGNRT